MALFKKTTTRHVDPSTDRQVPAGTPGAVKRTVRSAKWYGRFRDAGGVQRTVPLSRDKAAARALLAEKQRDAERGRAGLADPCADAARVPLTDHLAAYGRHLEAGGRSARYVREETARVRRTFEGAGFRLPGDVTAGGVGDYLADRRRDDGRTVPPDPDGRFGPKCGKPRTFKFGPKTSNHYLAACQAFTAWMVKDRRASADPLAYMSKLNAGKDVRRERRAATPAELAAVVAAAEAGPVRFGLPGSDRAVLYLTAAYTGLRAAELGSLTRRSVDLAGDRPTVTVSAAAAKNGKDAVLPLRADLAARLRDWFAARDAARQAPPVDAPRRRGRPATVPFRGGTDSAVEDAPLWPGRWSGDRKAAPMLRGDLADAGVPYEDEGGGKLDFHALRHTFVTNLARGGVHPKDAQLLARHSSITLTMDRYTHASVRDADAAVDRLPALPAPAGALRATGTGGAEGGPDPPVRAGGATGRATGNRPRPQVVGGAGGSGTAAPGCGPGGRRFKSGTSPYFSPADRAAADRAAAARSSRQFRDHLPAELAGLLVPAGVG